MKKVILTCFASLLVVSVFAQNSYLEIVRSTIKTEKKTLIAEVMQLTDAESSAFWPVYNEFEGKYYQLNTEYYDLVQDFASNFENMSADKSTEILLKANKYHVDKAKLEKSYIKKVTKVLPPQKALRFFQASNKISLMIDAALAAEIPLLENIE
jgi:hypothetical protein